MEAFIDLLNLGRHVRNDLADGCFAGESESKHKSGRIRWRKTAAPEVQSKEVTNVQKRALFELYHEIKPDRVQPLRTCCYVVK